MYAVPVISYSTGCRCKAPWMKVQCRNCRVTHFTSCISNNSDCRRTVPASVPLIVSLWFTRWGKFANKPPKTLFQLVWVTQKQSNKTFSTFLTTSCFAGCHTSDTTLTSQPCLLIQKKYRRDRILVIEYLSNPLLLFVHRLFSQKLFHDEQTLQLTHTRTHNLFSFLQAGSIKRCCGGGEEEGLKVFTKRANWSLLFRQLRWRYTLSNYIRQLRSGAELKQECVLQCVPHLSLLSSLRADVWCTDLFRDTMSCSKIAPNYFCLCEVPWDVCLAVCCSS